MSSKVAIFAGGCFWCMVKPFDKFEGVLDVQVGYIGGTIDNPTYEDVCTKNTGHYEAVKIIYEETIISYKELLEVFFMSIDPTDEDGQFNDRGDAYKTAIFYTSMSQKVLAEQYIRFLDSSRVYNKKIVTKIKEAKEFYPAEEYHQDYYLKNPVKYKMYYKGSGREKYIDEMLKVKVEIKDILKHRLTELQYRVTQEGATEPPFDNEYNDNYEEGIYVDIITGKPLFSSKDKFNSGCGWPAFSKPINKGYVKEIDDFSHGMVRTEVKSVNSGSHLGHVFNDGIKEAGGLRYCINSAALKFIPKSKMREEGYSEFIDKI